MFNRRAISKLKAILIIDILIVAVAAGTYLYLQNQGLIATAVKPAEFTVKDLTITPSEADEAEPILISATIKIQYIAQT